MRSDLSYLTKVLEIYLNKVLREIIYLVEHCTIPSFGPKKKNNKNSSRRLPFSESKGHKLKKKCRSDTHVIKLY